MYCSNNSRIITNIRHVTHIDLSICAAYAYAAYRVYESENFDSTAFPIHFVSWSQKLASPKQIIAQK